MAKRFTVNCFVDFWHTPVGTQGAIACRFTETLAQIKDWVVEPDLLSLAAQVQPAMQGNAQAQQQVSGALLCGRPLRHPQR